MALEHYYRRSSNVHPPQAGGSPHRTHGMTKGSPCTSHPKAEVLNGEQEGTAFLSASFKYNLYSIKFIFLSVLFNECRQMCIDAHHHHSHARQCFRPPPNSFVALHSQICLPACRPQRPLIHCLQPLGFPFLVLYINRILQHSVFCVWLPSLSRFIRVVVDISTSFIFTAG